MTCKDCVHFAVCSQFGCFEAGIGDNPEYKTCSDFLSNKEFKPVVRGEWVEDVELRCSVCGQKALRNYYYDVQSYSNFCPNCGADMRGEQK